MKLATIISILIFSAAQLFAQEEKRLPRTLTVESYADFTKQTTDVAAWITYDHKNFSVEARYGYDYKKNVSLYAGPLLLYKNWKVRLLPGVTFGNKMGISFSPTAIFDAKKFYMWNQPQYVIGLGNMPSNFSHWGEFYYKITNGVWAGITDRYYYDRFGHNFGIGPQLLLSYKDWFITFYWWIPLNKNDFKFYLDGGYEHDF